MKKISLSIGDEPGAIRIIQDSQTDPRKALAEFVENAIDSGARNCKIIRKKSKGQHGLIIRDDGPGFPPGPNGLPDFNRVATHLCDSIKKRLSESERTAIQGQYGIGILGFAAIGETLQIKSKATAPKTASWILKRGTIDSEMDEFDDPSFSQGSEIFIWPIGKTVKGSLTATKIAKYLGDELGERIKQNQIKIIVSDPHQKTSIPVVPKEFKGTRLRQFDKIMTKMGTNVHFHLYVVKRGVEGCVSIVRRGTKLLDDVTEVPELDDDPWNRGLLEGKIEFKSLNPPPATRKGVVPDQALDALVAACHSIEPELRAKLDEIEQQRKETADPKMIRKLQETFQEVMKELGDDYSWFDAPRRGPIPKEQSRSGGKRKGFLLSNGPLREVRILPRIGQVRPNETKSFKARALDPNGAVIPIGVSYHWSLDEVIGRIMPNGSELQFTAGALDDQRTTIRVVAELDNVTAEADAQVLVLDRKSANDGASLNITPIRDTRESWRSKFVVELSQLQYNTGHPDYIAIQKKGSVRLLRYIGQLVARHLVLYNFKGVGEEEIMERMLETLASIDAKL